MRIQDRSRWSVRLTIAACLAALYLASCSSLWASVKSSAAPAGGAAGGATVGLLAPPLGPIIGAAIGAVIVHAVAENAALRSGETIGEGALTKWRNRAWVAEDAIETAETGKAWALKWKTRLIWGAILFFLFLRRQWIWKTISGKGVRSRFWTLIHALVSGNKTRELAIGFDPLPRNLPTDADKEVIVARLEKSA